MWLSIGYTIPQKGDLSGGGAPTPERFDILAQNGTTTEMQSEDGTYIMIQQVSP